LRAYESGPTIGSGYGDPARQVMNQCLLLTRDVRLIGTVPAD